MSNKKYLLDSNFDPFDQLNLLKEKCNNISSHLYRINSCYLEELRNNLPQVIRTSLFFLITNSGGDDFGFSTVTSRKRFQLKIDKLVSHNLPLITIEHLNDLAKKIEEENIRNLNNAKNEMANTLKTKNNSEKMEDFSEFNSIYISSIPPLENLSITEGWKGELKFPYSIDNKENDIKSIIKDNWEKTSQKKVGDFIHPKGSWLATSEGGHFAAACSIGWMEGWPLCQGKLMPDFQIDGTKIQMLHRTVAMAVGIFLFYGVYKINNLCKEKTPLISKLLLIGLCLVILNGIIGGSYVIFADSQGFPEYLSLLHLMCGSLSLLCFIIAVLIVKVSEDYLMEEE